jgi:hypothetical protein
MPTGDVVNWNSAVQSGLVTEDGNGVHGVQGANCKGRLLAILDAKNIPPESQPVIFSGFGADNQALNVDIDD